MEQKPGSLDVIDPWRKEIYGYLKEMEQFHKSNDVASILRSLSAWAARATYMRCCTQRSTEKEVANFRTKELDPFLGQTEFQFKVWSRIQTVQQAEWEMVK